MKKFLFYLSIIAFIGCTEHFAKDFSTAYSKEPAFQIYFGNTHAHCNYSGDIVKSRANKGLGLDPQNIVENHFKLAKENGYQFYCVTDHSQYDVYTPEAFADVKAQAEKYTDQNFVAIRGFEFSENNGPDGTGHMNVYNSDTYLNALADGICIEFFHNWLAKPENKKVFVSFNHPQVNNYNNFYCYNEAAREHISLIELINGKNAKYPAFLNALSKGWKVSPVAGCDNHGIEGIAKWEARTGVAAKALTYDAIMEAMAAGRTYATFDKNLKLMYYVNGQPMGSVIDKKDKLKFNIEVSDPDNTNPEDKITKIEILGENGKIINSKTFAAYAAKWTVEIPTSEKYYFLKIYNSSMTEPVAYAAPVWIK